MNGKYCNVFYFQTLGEIGGIERYIQEIAKKYSKYDITCIYLNGHPKQVARLRKMIRTVRFTGKFDCEKVFIAHNGVNPADILLYPDKTEVNVVAHANYEVQNLCVNGSPYIDNYYGVSKWVAEAYERLLKKNGINKEVKVLYNPVDTTNTPKLLKLISATRLTSEKGKDDMIKLAEEFNKKKIPFIWLIFTNGSFPEIENVVTMPTNLDVRQYIKEADYLVLLSKTEGCPYNILEALSLGTACICHPIPSVLEIGVNENNSYILPFDMENIPIEEIYNIVPRFTYKPPKDTYNEVLIAKKSEYENKGIVEVKAIMPYEDIELGYIPGGKVFEVDRIRADDLIAKGKVIEV